MEQVATFLDQLDATGDGCLSEQDILAGMAKLFEDPREGLHNILGRELDWM